MLLRPVHAAALLRQVLPARETRSADDTPSNWLGSDGLSDALWRRHRRKTTGSASKKSRGTSTATTTMAVSAPPSPLLSADVWLVVAEVGDSGGAGGGAGSGAGGGVDGGEGGVDEMAGETDAGGGEGGEGGAGGGEGGDGTSGADGGGSGDGLEESGGTGARGGSGGSRGGMGSGGSAGGGAGGDGAASTLRREVFTIAGAESTETPAAERKAVAASAVESLPTRPALAWAAAT